MDYFSYQLLHRVHSPFARIFFCDIQANVYHSDSVPTAVCLCGMDLTQLCFQCLDILHRHSVSNMMKDQLGPLPRAFNSDLASYATTTAGYPVVKYRQQVSE